MTMMEERLTTETKKCGGNFFALVNLMNVGDMLWQKLIAI